MQRIKIKEEEIRRDSIRLGPQEKSTRHCCIIIRTPLTLIIISILYKNRFKNGAHGAIPIPSVKSTQVLEESPDDDQFISFRFDLRLPPEQGC